MKPIEISTLLEYKYLSGLSKSPDGNKCIFTVSQCSLADNSYHSCIYLYDRENQSLRQLTCGGREADAIWLDSETIIYPHAAKSGYECRKVPCTVYKALAINGEREYEFMSLPMKINWIKAMTADRFVLTASMNIEESQFSSDEERRLYYETKTKREESYIAVDEIPFRKDSAGYTNGYRTRAFIYEKSENKLTPISDKLQNIEFIEANDRRVIYSARKFTKEKPYLFKSGISIYDTKTQKLSSMISDDIYRIRYCGFMEDLPVFMGSKGLKYGYQENACFYCIDEATGKEKMFADNDLSVINGVGTDVRYGKQKTDQAAGNSIYYASTEGGSSFIKKADIKGSITKLTEKCGSVDSLTVCKDEVIFIGMRDNKPQELYSLKDGVEKQLTNFNGWVQDQYTTSQPVAINFENDGTPLEGWIIEPVNFQEDKSYPAILYIHGGHKLAFGPVYFHEMQVWANKGFFVFYCNPRGSESKDNDFADIIGKYGYVDGSDIMKFTDECLHIYPQIDPDRIGVGGGSYGGYMTNWLIGHTNRFKCAVSQRGISDFISQFGTSDTAYQFPMWQFDTDIWMDVNRYWDHSPLKYADRCRTPTLFIHSENDFRCPVTQGMEMFHALKYNGVEARMCIFKNESHELSRSGKPVNRLNRLVEITSWFVKYLK